MTRSWQQSLLAIFDSKKPLSEVASADLINRWNKRVAIKRGQPLVSVGQVEEHLYFVDEGALGIFYPVNGEEICAGFAYGQSLICSYPSFIRQQPSAYLIQALTKCKLNSIHRSDFFDLLTQHRELETAWRFLEEEALLGKIEREAEMLAYTPEQRLERLMKRSPQLFQIVAKKYIASYLRMTPETLSRIRLR